MSIKTSGSIYFDKLECTHCKTEIRLRGAVDVLKCTQCGAIYNKEYVRLINDDEIEASFSYEGFCCMESNFARQCMNICPSPYMFCEDHSSEETIEKQKSTIGSAQASVEKAQEKLAMMEKSRKTWIIMKLSGVNDEDDTVSES